MRDYKKYIFDLDYTLLIPYWSKEDEYLRASIFFETVLHKLESELLYGTIFS